MPPRHGTGCFFCLASKPCFENLPRNYDSIAKKPQGLEWHWLILDPIGAIVHLDISIICLTSFSCDKKEHNMWYAYILMSIEIQLGMSVQFFSNQFLA